MISFIIGIVLTYISFKNYNVLLFGIGFYFFLTGLLKIMIG